MLALGINNYLLLAVASGIFAIGGFVLAKKPSSSMHRSFFVFAAGTALWVFGMALLSVTRDFSFDILVNYGGLLCVLGFFLLAQTFPMKRFVRLHPLLAYGPFALAAIFVIPFDLINTGMEILPNGRLHPIPGPLLLPYSLMLFAYIASGCALFVRSFRAAKTHERLQITYMLVGTVGFIVVACVCDAILPALGITSLNLMGPLAGLFLIATIAYAIVRHRLMDIRVAIQRGLLYTLLICLIVSAYLVTLQAITLFFGTTPGSALGSALITTILGIFGVPFIERRFKKATDAIFFKDGYDYADALRSLSQLLYTTVELDELVAAAERGLRAIFKTQNATIALDADQEYESTAHDDGEHLTARIPIMLDGIRIGSFYVGERRSGDEYASRDIHLLETFAYQAATAFGRARLYDEARHYAEHLEEKVRERTADLASLHESQRQMMMDISHGLQTPLAVLRTKLDQIKAVIPEDAGIDTLEACLDDVSRLIRNLLRMARLESGSEAVRDEQIDLTALLAEIIEEVATIADADRISIHHSLDADVFVCGDPAKLREVMMNLMSNALRYMRPDGPREIFVTLRTDRESAVLAVADTGIGIAPDDIGRIFDRFYRANSAGASAGTGLGLAITKRIVERHSGTITAESELGRGTTMTVRLPLSDNTLKR